MNYGYIPYFIIHTSAPHQLLSTILSGVILSRMIVLKNVSKEIGGRRVLENVSMRVNPGEFICLSGASGAGKSMLMMMLIGAESPTSGAVMVDDVDLRAIPYPALKIFRRRVGVIYQDHKLLESRTVAENIAMSLDIAGMNDDAITVRVTELLARMGLTSVAQSFPRELSMGEKARVAIARAVAHKPLILLADEPTQSLDPVQAEDTIKLFRELSAQGTTVIFATHDIALAAMLQARVIELQRGKITGDSSREREPQVKIEKPLLKEAVSQFEEAVRTSQEKKRKVRITAIHSD